MIRVYHHSALEQHGRFANVVRHSCEIFDSQIDCTNPLRIFFSLHDILFFLPVFQDNSYAEFSILW